jgi:hypothetical protein
MTALVPPSVVARSAVAIYRQNQMIYCTDDEVVLRRLEADPDSKVSAAFNRLRRCAIVRSQRKRLPSDPARRGHDVGDHQRRMDPVLLISYVVQATNLANSAKVAVSQFQEKADAYRGAVDDARRLASFCKGNAPVELCFSLGKLIEYLDSQSKHWADAPYRLQIKRTSDPVILALRHLARIIRNEFRLSRPPHDPLRWLVEVALGLETEVASTVVDEALRQQSGVRRSLKLVEPPISDKRLKNIHKIGVSSA